MQLIKGYIYRLQTRTGQQKLAREHVMTFLGEDIHGNLSFNARPFAGTQSVAKADIVSIVPVRPGSGREDQGHYMNKVVR